MHPLEPSGGLLFPLELDEENLRYHQYFNRTLPFALKFNKLVHCGSRKAAEF